MEMPQILRTTLATVIATAALALSPALASALTIQPVGTGGFTNADPVAISWTNDAGPLVNASCVLDSNIVTCSTSSIQLNGLAEGTHSLTVNGVHLVNGECMTWIPIPPDNQMICVGWTQVGVNSADSISFTVDRTAPVVSITGGPGEGASTTQTTASFGVSASDGTVTCELDGAPLACAATAELTSLGLGAHQFSASSVDLAGNVGTATRNFTVIAGPVPGGDSGTPAATQKTLSAPKSAKLGKKIKLKVTCPEGCKVAVAFKTGKGKPVKAGTIVVRPGATTATFTPKRALTRKLKQALAKRKKVVAVFTLDRAAKTSRIKK